MKIVIKLIQRDIINGYYQVRYKILIFCCLVISSIISYAYNIDKGLLDGSYLEIASLGDLIQYIFLGPFDVAPLGNSFFRLPVVWLGFHMMVAYLVGDYIQDDLSGTGQLILIYSRKRFYWWVSKFVWVLVFVTSLYLLSYVILIVASLIFNFTLSFLITPQLSFALFAKDYSLTSIYSFILIYFILPLLTSFVVSEIQATLTLIVKPVLAFVLVICLYVLSIYVINPFLITNYAIPAHNSVYIDGGMDAVLGIVSLCFLLIVVFIIGSILFKYKDFLERIE